MAVETDARQTRAMPEPVRRALLQIRSGILEEVRADEMEAEARSIRKRARLRQVRALEVLLGITPADAARQRAAEPPDTS